MSRTGQNRFPKSCPHDAGRYVLLLKKRLIRRDDKGLRRSNFIRFSRHNLKGNQKGFRPDVNVFKLSKANPINPEHRSGEKACRIIPKKALKTTRFSKAEREPPALRRVPLSSAYWAQKKLRKSAKKWILPLAKRRTLCYNTFCSDARDKQAWVGSRVAKGSRL